MSNSQTIVGIKWPYGEKASKYTISPYTQLHEVPAKPGTYIWLLRPRNSNEFLLACKLFEHATLDAQVRGNTRLKYIGELKKKIKNPEFSGDMNAEELFADLFVAIGYPLYIGISQDLKSRLRTHKAQFEEHLSFRGKRKPPADIDPDDFDSDTESAYFGARLSQVWGELSRDALYVKYVVPRICDGCNATNCNKACLNAVMKPLREVEYSANSLFNPVFGRR